MKASTLLLAVVGGLAALSAHADCDQPPLVVIPADDDLEAREAQIDEEARQYFQAMQVYVTCIREELAAAGDDASELLTTVLVQRNNAAVREAEAVQRWYNSRFPNGENDSAEED